MCWGHKYNRWCTMCWVTGIIDVVECVGITGIIDVVECVWVTGIIDGVQCVGSQV